MLGESLTDAGGSGGRKENAPPFRKAADISQFLAPRETSSQSNHHQEPSSLVIGPVYSAGYQHVSTGFVAITTTHRNGFWK